MSKIESKECFKCGEVKLLTAFYKHKAMGDGHLNKCKDCTKKDTKRRTDVLSKDPVWAKAEKERGRKKYHRLNYRGKFNQTPENKRKSILKNREKYPEKYRAKVFLGKKIKAKTKGNNLHHWSYNDEHFSDVTELTVKDHNTAHRFMVYDQERKMYRCAETGILLDTKEAHLIFINEHIDCDLTEEIKKSKL